MSDVTRAAANIQQQWGLQVQDSITEEELLNMLAARIAVLLERDTESFFQLMYKLDISEKRLHEAFSSDNPPASIAKLVYQRQLQKIESRRNFSSSTDADDDMKW